MAKCACRGSQVELAIVDPNAASNEIEARVLDLSGNLVASVTLTDIGGKVFWGVWTPQDTGGYIIEYNTIVKKYEIVYVSACEEIPLTDIIERLNSAIGKLSVRRC